MTNAARRRGPRARATAARSPDDSLVRAPRGWRVAGVAMGLVLGLAACDPRPATTPDVADASPTDDIARSDATDDLASDAVSDAPPDVLEPAPRQIAPLSTSTVTSQRPTLHWAATSATAVHAEVCADRACATIEQDLLATGTHATLATALRPGAHFWRLRDGARTTPVWSFHVRHASAPVDSSSGSVADVNNDGLADLLVGASHASDQRGRVDVYLGSASGVAMTPASRLDGPEPFGHFGWWVASAGDVNGDGYADVIVGAADVRNNDGAAYVYLGSAAGLSPQPARTLTPPEPMSNFGTVTTGVGDVNGDGYADVMVGAPNVALGTGRGYVYLGSAAGLSPEPAAAIESPAGQGGSFGSAIVGAGDVNGDGYSDVLIGANGASMSAGQAFVYHGGPMGLAGPVVSLSDAAAVPGTQFGAFVGSVGDINADGYSDIAAGAASSGAGHALIFLGGRAGVARAPAAVLEGPDGANTAFGWAVTGAGDVNGDGYDDVVVGGICALFGVDVDGGYPHCGTGRAYVYHSGAAGLPAVPSLVLEGPVLEAGFGFSLAGGGDANGDGFGDLAVGAYSLGAYSGGVFLFAGSAGGLGAQPVFSALGAPNVAENYGWSLAL